MEEVAFKKNISTRTKSWVREPFVFLKMVGKCLHQQKALFRFPPMSQLRGFMGNLESQWRARKQIIAVYHYRSRHYLLLEGSPRVWIDTYSCLYPQFQEIRTTFILCTHLCQKGSARFFWHQATFLQSNVPLSNRISGMVKMFYICSIQYSHHQSHVVMAHLKCG